MAWCRQAPSHYASQCWPRSVSLYGGTRPQWVNNVLQMPCSFCVRKCTKWLTESSPALSPFWKYARYYSDVTWASWHLKSQTTPLCRSTTTKTTTIKAMYCWPFVVRIHPWPTDSSLPKCGKRFSAMTSMFCGVPVLGRNRVVVTILPVPAHLWRRYVNRYILQHWQRGHGTSVGA